MSEAKILNFNLAQFALVDSENTSVFLRDIIWENLPWNEGQIKEINLNDLPCRIDGSALPHCLRALWKIAGEGATLSIRIPHPRHDSFLKDIGYVRPLLPEAFFKGIGGISFKHIETALILDPFWQKAVDEKEVTYEEIHEISKQACNVIEWMNIRLEVNKFKLLTPEMREQLVRQIGDTEARGDYKAAETIRKFLEKESEVR